MSWNSWIFWQGWGSWPACHSSVVLLGWQRWSGHSNIILHDSWTHCIMMAIVSFVVAWVTRSTWVDVVHDIPLTQEQPNDLPNGKSVRSNWFEWLIFLTKCATVISMNWYHYLWEGACWLLGTCSRRNHPCSRAARSGQEFYITHSRLRCSRLDIGIKVH